MARHSTSSCERESRPAAKTGASTTGQQARLCGARRRTAQRHWNRLAGSGVAASSAEATIDIAGVTKRPNQLGWFHVAPPRRRALARDAVQSLGEFPRSGRSRTTGRGRRQPLGRRRSDDCNRCGATAPVKPRTGCSGSVSRRALDGGSPLERCSPIGRPASDLARRGKHV